MVPIENIVIAPETLSAPVDPTAWFGNSNPVELEIGCGKGGFLLRQAQAHPERNFVGIEWANEFFKFTSDRMARWGVTNVRVLRTDAKHFVIHRLTPDCLAAIHIYHPDPWPKKRHHKRRLITTDFVDAACRALKSGGRLAIQTDHAEYFEQIKAATQGRPELIADSFDDPQFGIIDEQAKTNFEIKYLREGRPIFRLAFKLA